MTKSLIEYKQELIQFIRELEITQDYLRIVVQLEEHDEINLLIQQKKHKQQELITAKHIKKMIW